MRKFFVIIFALCLCMVLSVSTFAASTYEIAEKKSFKILRQAIRWKTCTAAVQHGARTG